MKKLIFFLLLIISLDSFSQCNLTISKDIVCAGEKVVFSIPSSITFYHIVWNFGDGKYSVQNSHQVEYAYKDAGTYNACVTLYNSNNTVKCGPNCQTITILDGPKAKFDINHLGKFCQWDSVLVFKNLTVESKEKAPIIDYFWLFSDGDTSHSENPGHYFKMHGNYFVYLDVTDSIGCKSSYEMDFSIPYYHKLKPYFNLSSTNKCKESKDYLLNLTDTIGKKITNWYWDFNDGKGWQEVAKNDTVKIFYTHSSIYIFRLKVKSNWGCEDSIEKQVIVRTGNFKADFDTAASPEVCAPQAVKFLNKTTLVSYDQIKSSKWFFYNDENKLIHTSTLLDPVWTFAKNGQYHVKLIVVSDSGCTDSIYKRDYINVLGPQPKFWLFKNDKKVYTDTIHIGEYVQILDSSKNVTNWQFVKGDKSYYTDTSRPFNHIFKIKYNKAGTYRIYLNGTSKVYFPIPAPGYWGNCSSVFGDSNMHPEDPTFRVVVLDTATNIHLREKACTISIYPNPADNQIIIISDIFPYKVKNAEIFDIYGKIVMTVPFEFFEQNSNQINVNALPNGLYFLKITTTNQLYVNRFRIIH